MQKDRTKFIGASDANQLMQGKWHQLWLEKTGKGEPEDLSGELRVQLGIFTEPFNLEWFAKAVDVTVAVGPLNNTQTFTNEYGFPMACTPDGVVPAEQIGVEAKHTNERNTLEKALDYYMPQLQHSMAVTGLDAWYLSVLFGNARHEWALVERSESYIKRLIEIEETFWSMVKDGTEPDDEFEQAGMSHYASTDDVKVNGQVALDMTGSNQFADLATTFLDNQEAAKAFDQAKKELRGWITDTERKVYGHGVQIVRKGKKIFVEAEKEEAA